MTLFFRLALAVTLLALSALAAPIHRPATAQTGGRAQQLAVDPSALIIETAGGDRAFSVEIAARPDERSRGLMYRETMPADRGMLFVFEQTRPVGFWMQNTSLPLDLLFISERGRIRAILPGRPFSTDLISADEPVRFVLELNAGIAQKTGIKVGDRVRHPVIESGTRGR